MGKWLPIRWIRTDFLLGRERTAIHFEYGTYWLIYRKNVDPYLQNWCFKNEWGLL